MSGKDIFDAMGAVDERFIEEAEREYPAAQKKISWIKYLSLAACICLILLCSHFMSGLKELPPGILPPESPHTVLVTLPTSLGDYDLHASEDQSKGGLSFGNPNYGSSLTTPDNCLSLCFVAQTEYCYLASVLPMCYDEALKAGNEVKVILQLSENDETRIPEMDASCILFVKVYAYSYDENTNTLYVYKCECFTLPVVED